ncbi:MAG TPA: hypothetical protein VK613_12125, partial [Gaiellaceae bacterium]|nr:hypothetical protein [Gaiellaceae bacterium]
DHQFAPPTLESVAVAGKSDDRARLRVALAQLAEQDPLINVRQDDTRQELSVSLYGEVQKEVIQATLANEFGLEVRFRETTPIYIERPIRTGEAIEILNAESNPFLATIGLRIDPAPNGSGSLSDCKSILAPFRCTSTRRSLDSRSAWISTSAKRCGKGSSVGRSRTAS